MKNLISMTDFVLRFGEESNRYNYEQAYDKISSYANFLRQPSELWMFVPCSEDGDILEEPSHYLLWTFGIAPDDTQMNSCQEYQQAKDRCLFKGFEVNPKGYADYTEDYLKIDEEYCQNSTIEDLVCFNLELSKTAIKQLGL